MQMSDFLGSRSNRNGAAAAAPTTWWNWNPARRTVAPGTVETADVGVVNAPWWRRNLSGRTVAAPVGATVTGPAVTTPTATAAAVDEDRIRRTAYDQGRRDERRRRRGSPIASLMVVLAAIVGAVFVGLGVLHGSFAGGGAVVDHEITLLPGQTASVVHRVQAASAPSTPSNATVQPSSPPAPAAN